MGRSYRKSSVATRADAKGPTLIDTFRALRWQSRWPNSVEDMGLQAAEMLAMPRNKRMTC